MWVQVHCMLGDSIGGVFVYCMLGDSIGEGF